MYCRLLLFALVAHLSACGTAPSTAADGDATADVGGGDAPADSTAGDAVTDPGGGDISVDFGGRDAMTDSGIFDSIAVDSGGGDAPSGRVPERHRPEHVACDDQRSTDGPTIPEGMEEMANCTSHDDCTEGDNGRCSDFGRGFWGCTYDQCFSDDDCGVSACICGGDVAPNHCMGGDCQVDADCGPGGYCSPTFGECGNYSGEIAYYCHTPDDECIDDGDCGDNEWSYCAYNPAAGHWACSDSHCAG